MAQSESTFRLLEMLLQTNTRLQSVCTDKMAAADINICYSRLH